MELTFTLNDEESGDKGRDETILQFQQDIDEVINHMRNPQIRELKKTVLKTKLYQDVFNSRTMTDKFNAVEPGYDGRTITDTNALIPKWLTIQLYIVLWTNQTRRIKLDELETSTQSYKPKRK